MNDRTSRLRRQSLDAPPCISGERARLLTEFYQANKGKYSVPVMRARPFHYLCQHKTIYLGDGELIVGERGPRPKAVPTYPELTCHSVEDLQHPQFPAQDQLRRVGERCLRLYEEKIIPYWRGRSMRDKLFAALPAEWKEAYDAGMFTEFMEQRAPGHTVLDDKIYRKGLLDFKREIAAAIAALDFLGDPRGLRPAGAVAAMDISCDAVHPLRPAACRACPAGGRRGSRSGPQGRVGEDRRGLHARAGPCPAGFSRGPAEPIGSATWR